MLPAPLLAAVAVLVFPLHAEINCNPLALRVGTAYKFRVAVEFATGKKAETEIGIGAAATPKDVAEAIFLSLSDTVTMRQQGDVVIVTEFDGSPVRRVTFEFREAGPKPIVRWVPRRK